MIVYASAISAKSRFCLWSAHNENIEKFIKSWNFAVESIVHLKFDQQTQNHGLLWRMLEKCKSKKICLEFISRDRQKVSVLFIWENLFPSKLTRNIQTRSRWSYHRMFRINFNLLNTALWGWSRVDWNIGKGFPFASSSSLNAQCESRRCLPRDKKRIFYLASRLLFLLRRHIFEMIEDA